MPRTLPFARREAVAALKDDYASGDEALARHRRAAAQGVCVAFERPGARRAPSPRVQDIYARNVFPAMKVTWGTYPNNIGHTFFNGCFRCHDDNHKASDGSVIKQDCETCHAMP